MNGNDKELWQQCIGWMKSAGVLREDESFSKLADFAMILRNGVLLCELAMKLSPGCIDRHEILAQYQHSPFICSKNIALFLTACRDDFSIGEELFSEDDLFELQNFPAVLRLLSQLSRNQKSRKLGLKPFPEETILPTEVLTDESIYCNLKEEVDQHYKQLQAQYAVLNKKGKDWDERSGQEIYDSICSQKVPRNKSLPVSYSEFKPTNKREHCLKELLDTEVNYCDKFLQMIVDTFFTRMRFYLRSEDLSTIFINIEDILRINRSFLSKLGLAVTRALGLDANNPEPLKSGEPLQIADVFLTFKMQFTIYAIYCSRLSASANKIEELERTDPNIRRIITELAKDIQFKLQDLLIIPFQRITKYHLILENLAKSTQDVMEQSALNNAFDAMKDLVAYVNEMKRDQEMIEFVNTIQRSISSLDVNLLDYGRILCDDSLRVNITENGDSNKSKQRYVFLFEKMILCAKREAGMYKAKNIFVLSDFELLENELEFPHKYNTISRKLTNSFFDINTFSIVKREPGSNGQSQLTSIQMVFKTMDHKKHWKELVKKAIDINNPKAATAKGHCLLYKTYSKATVCSVCQMLLAGKFFQGYHCSGCNKDMHRECAQLKECMLRKSPEFANGNEKANGSRAHPNFHAGEVVVSRQTIPPNGNSRLSCQNGDLLELLEVHPEDGTALARLSLQPQSMGLVPLDVLVRTARTLENVRKRASRSSNSLSEVIPLQHNGSPSPSHLASSPQTPPNPHPLSLARHRQFVSSHIIRLNEHLPDVHEQPWYFGELGREQAKNLLDGTEDGTFIVRWSVERQQFAISFRIGGAVKHIKVEYEPETRNFFLYMERHFESVVELVNFYRNNNLSEGFALDAILKGTPLKGSLYRAVSAYSRPESSKYLTLSPGDIVRVLDTAGDGNGWWKGSVNGERIGFFPVSYVERIPELNGQPTTPNGEQPRNSIVAYQSTPNGEKEPIQLDIQPETEEKKKNNSPQNEEQPNDHQLGQPEESVL